MPDVAYVRLAVVINQLRLERKRAILQSLKHNVRKRALTLIAESPQAK